MSDGAADGVPPFVREISPHIHRPVTAYVCSGGLRVDRNEQSAYPPPTADSNRFDIAARAWNMDPGGRNPKENT